MASQEYLEYLRSQHWRDFRKEALEYYGHICCGCGTNDNLHVHHRTYKNIGNESMEDVVVLCKSCHFREHSHLYRFTPNPCEHPNLDNAVINDEMFCWMCRDCNHIILGREPSEAEARMYERKKERDRKRFIGRMVKDAEKQRKELSKSISKKSKKKKIKHTPEYWAKQKAKQEANV